MRKCAFCGTDNADGEVFCGLCGQRLDTMLNEPTNDQSADPSENPIENSSLESTPASKSVFCPLCNGSGEIEHIYHTDIIFEDQEYINKVCKMISALSDDEVVAQIDNILEWAERYKKLLADELLQRGHTEQPVHDESAVQVDKYTDEDDGFCTDEDLSRSAFVVDETIDYNLAQMIQQKVAAFSIAETEEALQKLRSIPEYRLSEDEQAQLHYEIDTCEIHLFELTGDVNE